MDGQAAPVARYPGAGRAWYTIAILFLLYSMSFIDRLILALLAPAVSEHLNVSDTQIGILFGMGFGVVYALIGLPLAHLVDKHHRVRLIVAGVTLWSACTVASGFAHDYGTLMLLRAGVAVGEAVLSPAAISLIGDSFPRNKRTLPTTVYNAVPTFMGSASFVIGGAALHVAAGMADNWGMEPWQLTLVFVGVPGLLLAPLLLFTVREPARMDAAKTQDFGTVRQAFDYVMKERMLYGCIFLGAAMMSMASFAKTAWIPTLLIRGHQIPAPEVGFLYGTIGLCSGLAGAFVWPALAKAWTARGRRDALVTVFAVCITVSWIALAVVGLTRSHTVLLVWAGISIFFGTAHAILIPLLIQLVTPGRMRGRIMAGYLMANNLVGLALGPPLAAFIGDRFFEGNFAIGSGLAVLVCTVGPIATVAFFLLRPAYARALDEAEARERDLVAG